MHSGAQKKLYEPLQWLIMLVAVSYFLVPYFPRESFSFVGKQFFVTQLFMLAAVVIFPVVLAYSSALKDTILSLVRLWRVYVPFAGCLFIIGVSTVVALGLTTATLSRVLSLVAIALIFFLFALLSQTFIDRFLVMSAWFTLLASVLGVLQFFGGTTFAPAFHLTGRGEAFAVGFAKHSSLFGLHLSAFLLLFWLLFLLNYQGKRKWWGTTFFLGIPAFVLTFSRGAWLAAGIAGIAALLWLWVDHRERFVTAFTSLSIALPIALVTLALSVPLSIFTREEVVEERSVPTAVEERPLPTVVAERFSVEDKSSVSRILFHQAAFNMLFENPRNFLIGLGSWGFYDAWPRFDPEQKIRDNIDPHSTFLEVVTAGGILAFIFFVLFLWFLYKVSWKERQHNILLAPLLLAFLAILVNGLTHTHLYTKYMWIIAGIILALLVIENNRIGKGTIEA